MAKGSWSPQLSRHGLTLWTYTAPRKARTFIQVRRDSDGGIVSSARFWKRTLVKGKMRDLVEGFSRIRPFVGRVLTDHEQDNPCSGCRKVSRAAAAELNDMLQTYTE